MQKAVDVQHDLDAKYQQALRALKQARQELEKRISEHDTCVEEKRSAKLLAVTLHQIKDQEAVVAEASKQHKVRGFSANW